MNITKKIFWREAVKGGTITGLLSIAFSILQYALRSVEDKLWISLVWWAGLIAFIALVYAFTRKISRSADRAQGFTYNRCVGFVLAMMLFYGFLTGVYSAIFNNFVDPEGVMRAIDLSVVNMQDILTGEDFDTYYSAMKAVMFNPVAVVLTSILGSVVKGLIVGLVTSAFAKRDPDIFAAPAPETEENN
jgi:hypothetical protein